jgi:poly(hydroxyalkanoate) granule-associated protein
MATRKKATRSRTAQAGRAQARLLEAVHQVWLAGLGAASRTQTQGPKLFKDLVAEGARVHNATRRATVKAVRGALSDVQGGIAARVEQAREQAGDAFENLEKMFQIRVHRALNQLGVPSAEEIAALSKRVDALNANIDKLTRHRRPVRTTHSKPARTHAEHVRHAA